MPKTMKLEFPEGSDRSPRVKERLWIVVPIEGADPGSALVEVESVEIDDRGSRVCDLRWIEGDELPSPLPDSGNEGADDA